MRLFNIVAALLVLTSCSWMAGGESDNYHWQSAADGKHEDERTEQERTERDLSQCVAQAHGFNVETDQCMQGRGYEKHFD